MHAPPRDSWRWAALATLPALALLAWQVSWPWPFFSDDAFISLRYSERLLAGDGLTWTDGERVEGYSNLLWVLLCSGFGALGVDLVDAARGLGAATTALALLALARAMRPHDAGSALAASLAPLLVASTQVAMGWTCGGLEGPLVLCCLSWGFAALVRARASASDGAPWPQQPLLAASVPFALLCWTRPDGVLWVAATATGVALAGWRRDFAGALDRTLRLGSLPVLAVLAQLAFRWLYYRDLVPNTAHVKAEFEASALPAGLEYVGRALLAHAGLALPAAAGFVVLLARERGRGLALVLGAPLLTWLLYLVAIGGDHFPCRRLLHAALVPLALLAAVGLAALPRRARAVGLLLLLAGVAGNVYVARTDAQSRELRAETWEWQGREVGRALHAAFGEQRPRLAVDAAGAVPFYSGLPSLDLLGLCDRTIATTPTPSWLATMVPGTPRPPGHLRGNGSYVLDRAPDLFLFGPPPGQPLPVFVSGAELEDDPRFLSRYRLVRVDLGERPIVPGLVLPTTVNLWVKVDGRVGVRTRNEPDERGEHVEIPAWLFGAFELRTPLVRRYQPPPENPAAVAEHARHFGELVQWLGAPTSHAIADERGHLRTMVAARTAALRLQLATGTYRATLRPEIPGASVHCTTATAGRSDGEFVVRVAAEHELQLQIDEGVPLPVTIERVDLLRTVR